MQCYNIQATTAQLAMLFSTLAVAGGGVAGLLFLLSYLISLWLLIFLQSSLLVWIILDNITIYEDLRHKEAPQTKFKLLEKFHIETISDLALSAKKLSDRNLQLTKTINSYNTITLANLHWNLLYSKAMAMHHIRCLAQPKKRRMRLKQCVSDPILYAKRGLMRQRSVSMSDVKHYN